MKSAYQLMLFVVMATSVCVAYENDGPYAGQSVAKTKAVRLMSAGTASGFPAPEPSDVRIVVTDGGNLGQEVWTGGEIAIPFAIERYFGNRDKMIKSGALPKWVAMTLVNYDVDSGSSYSPAEYDEVWVNGNKLKQALQGLDEQWTKQHLLIDTKYLNFPSAPGRSAENKIVVKVATKGGNWVTKIDWVAIDIPAAPPVVLSHGINSSAADLSALKEEIEDLGLPVVAFDQENHGNESIGTIGNLTQTIDVWKRLWKVEKVNIVGHSMGGLRARHYAENADDVFKVLQIGTPNGGSPLADFLINSRNNELSEIELRRTGMSERELEAWRSTTRNAWEKRLLKLLAHGSFADVHINVWTDRAIEDLRTSSMLTYNGCHELNSKVDYKVVAGQVTWLRDATIVDGWDLIHPEFGIDQKCECLNAVLKGIDPRLAYDAEPTDMIVPVHSAHTVVTPANGSPLRGRSGIAWHSGLVDGGASEVVGILKPYLTEQKPVVASEKSNITNPSLLSTAVPLLSASSSPSITQPSYFTQSGFVEDESVVDVDFYIVNGGETGVSLLVGGEAASIDGLTLHSPEGIEYKGDENGISVTNFDGIVSAVLDNPSAGKWTASFCVKKGPASWSLSVNELGSDVEFAPSLDTDSVRVGEPMVVRVNPKVSGIAAECTCMAVIRYPNGSYVTKSFTEDGGSGYMLKLPTTETGQYQIVVRVSDDIRKGLLRVASLTRIAGESGVSLDNSVDFLEVDSDADGLYDSLVARFGMVSTRKSKFRIVATLSDADGIEIAKGWTSNMVCSAGQAYFPVSFDGAKIYSHGATSRYVISDVKLYEVTDTYEALADSRSNIASTSAYSYSQFEHAAVGFESGSDHAVDADKDGVYDALNVALNLRSDASVAGTYSWSAALQDSTGTLLGFTSGSANFPVGGGTTPIAMQFPSTDIVNTHQDGAYEVCNFIMWKNSGSGPATVELSDKYTTARYAISSFGGELATVDLGFIVPSGWPDSLIASTNAVGTTGQTVFEQGDPIYINYAFANIANHEAVSNFVNRFTLRNEGYFSDSWEGYTLAGGGWGWLGEGFAPTVLQNLPPGTYTLTCELDADGQLLETDEYNNVAEITFIVKESAKPNLKIGAATVSKQSITISEPAIVHWRVDNDGASAAGKTQTAFQIWKYDSSAENWILRKTEWLDCNPLASGAGRECTRTVTGKSLGVGKYIFRVWTDGKDAVREKNESDNYADTYSLTVEKDNAVKSSSSVDWQFRKYKSSEPDSFFLSASSSLKKKATTFKVGQTIYMRRAFWNAKKKTVYGRITSRYWLNGQYSEAVMESSSVAAKTIVYNTTKAPAFLQNLPAGKYTLTAEIDSDNHWWETNEKNNIRRISFTVVDSPVIYGESAYTCALRESVSWPVSSEGTVTVKGLPPGLKYSGGAIAGKATKTGTYSAKFTSKNAAGTKTKTIKITVVNPGFSVDVTVRANGATEGMSVASGETIPMYVGVKQRIAVASEPGKAGVSKSAVSAVTVKGLPTGLKYSKGVISGVPSKTGTYTVKLTFKNALGWSKTVSYKFAVKALPSFAKGSFNGWTAAVDAEGYWVIKRKVAVAVSSAGKISAKVGSLTFTHTGWTVEERPDGTMRYVANMRTVRTTGTGKKKKKQTDVLSVALDPNAPWDDVQIEGAAATFDGEVALADALAALEAEAGSSLAPENDDVEMYAWRNPYANVAEAKAIAEELAAMGTQKLTDDAGVVWNVKVGKNGVAVISRTTGSGKNKKTVSATTVVQILAVEDEGYDVSVRFIVGGRFISAYWDDWIM